MTEFSSSKTMSSLESIKSFSRSERVSEDLTRTIAFESLIFSIID